MPRIALPEPSLVVLIGPAGSGKSTLAGRHFGADEILSSDAFRELISGDAADQRATRPAFARLERTLRQRLAAGRTTVVDATSLSRQARRSLLRSAEAAGVPAVALVLDLPIPIVLARNADRARVVDRSVVLDHLARLRALMDGGTLAEEGFARVWWLRNPRAVDALAIERSGGAPVRRPSRR